MGVARSSGRRFPPTPEIACNRRGPAREQAPQGWSFCRTARHLDRCDRTACNGDESKGNAKEQAHRKGSFTREICLPATADTCKAMVVFTRYTVAVLSPEDRISVVRYMLLPGDQETRKRLQRHSVVLTTSHFEDEEDTLSSPMPPAGPAVTGEARARSNTTQRKRKIEVWDVEKLREVLHTSIEQRSATPQLPNDEDKLFLLPLLKDIKDIPSDLAQTEPVSVVLWDHMSVYWPWPEEIWTALNIEVLRADEETGYPRGNPPVNGIVRHDSHVRESGVTRPGIEPGSPWWEAIRLIA
ncbi:hypothetical protein PR048_004694 [Dryococelus australis]|uniref:Uncharacterized protein n=1 Tax=Dryococelus australis TaxID=614101 RepID=A0ABQ9I630_9NEOP|nr:hypothetical protein PR048_004694 [Dryococelus australis]